MERIERLVLLNDNQDIQLEHPPAYVNVIIDHADPGQFIG